MNNIFKFATGELSQDAFICWFFNWFNEGDNPKLKQLVCDFCKTKLDIPDVTSIDIHRQFSRKVEKDGISFSVKIDVLIIVNREIAVIIEDKTFTSEHSNQILRYEEGLRILQEKDDEGKLKIENDAYTITKIMSVYWKTGFFYDCDKCVKADIIISSDDLLEVLKNFRSENLLIDMYVQKLEDDKQWYIDHAKYWDLADENGEKDDWNTNLSKHQIAQYTMMREVFPEEMWNNENHYYIDHGSSFGRPWTEIWIYCDRLWKDPNGNERFEIFWRIDTNKDGSYISLRLYKHIKGRWDDKYKDIKTQVETFIQNNGLISWADVNPGKTDSYKEADIAHFTINEKLWNEKGQELKQLIRDLTTEIEMYAEEKYGPNRFEVTSEEDK